MICDSRMWFAHHWLLIFLHFMLDSANPWKSETSQNTYQNIRMHISYKQDICHLVHRTYRRVLWQMAGVEHAGRESHEYEDIVEPAPTSRGQHKERISVGRQVQQTPVHGVDKKVLDECQLHDTAHSEQHVDMFLHCQESLLSKPQVTSFRLQRIP